MGGRFDYDRAASVLVEAAYYGDKQAADRWGLSERTVSRYRNRLDDDEKLSRIVGRKKEAFENEWANEIPAALRSAIRFLVRAGEEADPKDPDAIHAVAGALKMLAEVGFTKALLDVRFGEFYRENGTEDGEVDAIESPKYLNERGQ